ncbi:hypothetical protein AB0H86_15120 [Streptomyces sp. NPDC050997]|uniref:hypothetical protein n=1 Tax=Streptomyces sp. NPDC050997 TaxID=3155519 RepID=UPI0034234919
MAAEGEPRPEYAPGGLVEPKYAAKAEELGVSVRRHGESGLAPRRVRQGRAQPAADDRWVETALEVMVEHTGQRLPHPRLEG